MTTIAPLDRQNELEQIVTKALEDPDLIEALEAFQIGQKEYYRAISGSRAVKIFSGNSTNFGEQADADLDTN